MPRMIDTTPIQGSTFVMTVRCICRSTRYNCGIHGIDFTCAGCGLKIPRKEHYDADMKLIEGANWRYDPIPEAATNL